jgi:acyl carrier protein
MSNKAVVAELEIAEIIVSIGSLEITPQDMDPEQPIFGDGSGLDSIDALELAFRIEQRYGVVIKADSEDVHEVFASLRSLTHYINRKLRT